MQWRDCKHKGAGAGITRASRFSHVAAPDVAAARKRESRLAAASGVQPIAAISALARLETRVGLADHEDLATTADHLAVAVTGLRRLQGGQDLHDEPRQKMDGRNAKPGILTGFLRRLKWLHYTRSP